MKNNLAVCSKCNDGICKCPRPTGTALSVFRFFLFSLSLFVLCGSTKAGELFSNLSANVAYGANTDSGNQVYALAITTPINKNISLGVIGANDGGRWLVGAATINLGTEIRLTERLGITGNIGTGPAIDWQTKRATAYTFVDVGPNLHLTKNISIGTRAVVANVADRNGVDILGLAGVSWKF